MGQELVAMGRWSQVIRSHLTDLDGCRGGECWALTVAAAHIRGLDKKDCVWLTVGCLLWKHDRQTAIWELRMGSL